VDERMERLIERLVRDDRVGPSIVYRGLRPADPSRHGEPALGWPRDAAGCMRALGVGRLYSHQCELLDAAMRGENAVVATPTASGKTLAYLVSFLARRDLQPEARALFLYPLKALARDQMGAVRTFLEPLGLGPAAAADVYDGDTPEAARRRMRREPPAVLISNPDMVHMGMLPYHDAWAGFLRRLKLIVIDEAHVYRGVFGAHVHHVLRRLIRLARHHGGDPLVLAGSATIGSPGEMVGCLTGEPVTTIEASGAPTSIRHVLFVEPEMVSPYTVATHVVARCVESGDRKSVV
jgi:DEAD/DEAH box helicase domain-containing protein